MGIKNKKNDSNDSVLRVDWDEIKNIENVYHNKGKPFTGICYRLYENGNLETESEIKNGLSHGCSKTWYEDGNLWIEEKHDMDELLLKKIYFKNGKLEYSEVFQPKRTIKRWYENGNLKFEGERGEDYSFLFKNHYHENGKIKHEMKFTEKKIFEKCWNKDGNEIICDPNTTDTYIED